MQSFFVNSGMYGLLNLFRQKKIRFIFLAYLLISLIILFKAGINIGGEATKYIEDANRILNGESLRVNFFSNFYLLYSLLVAIFLKLHLSFEFIGVIQILLSFISSCCIYKLLFFITRDKIVSFVAMAFYLLCLPIQQWNFFLYTESLHTSLTVMGTYFLFSLFQKMQPQRGVYFLIFLLLIIFSRPVGILFLLASITTGVLWMYKNKKMAIFYSLITILFLIILFLFLSDISFYFNPDSVRRMEIICQVPQANQNLNYKEYNTSGLQDFFKIIFKEIGIKNFVTLGLKKTGYFFGMIRSYYSFGHNAILLSAAFLLYPFAITGIFFFGNSRSVYLKIFSFTYILITSAGIFFTCDEWSNRFVAPVLPQVIIFAGLGFHFLKEKFINKKYLQH